MIWTAIGRDPAPRMNLNDRPHWSTERRDAKAWRKAGWALGNSIRPKPKITGIATFLLELGTDTPGKRRDPNNWAKTAKHLSDGFTDAGFWPDDDSKHVTVAEPIFTTAIPPDQYRVTITWSDE